MSKFKVGERVKYVGTVWPDRVGMVGTVETYDGPLSSQEDYYRVRFDAFGCNVGCYGRSLEKVKE